MSDFYAQITTLAETVMEKAWPDERLEIVDFIESATKHFPAYVDQVCASVISDRMAGIRLRTGAYDTEKFQDIVKSNDERRHMKHETAIGAVKQLNRLCDRFGLEHICPDTDDRLEIGEFCAKVTNELFLVGTSREARTLDEVVHEVDNNGASIDTRKKVLTDMER